VSLNISFRCCRTVFFAALTAFVLIPGAESQTAPPAQTPNPAEAAAATAGKDRIILVLPFDNRTGQLSLEWMREAAATLLSSRFASAGFAPMSRADRLYALDHLGLPQGFQPSRASSLKLAQTLDADSIVVGNYINDGSRLIVEGRIVDVTRMRMGPPVTVSGDMKAMIAVFDQLAWRLTRQLDPGFNVSQETFVAAGANLRPEAFEQYIRGISESDHAERLRHLQQAVTLSPGFAPAWMALGREDYDGQQYEQAAAAFAKVGRDDPDYLEAAFYRGLSLMFSGNYARAEGDFAAIARVLPLAQVINNQGVSVSRQGHDGTAMFRQAVATDPDEPDYHFNLAVSLKRHGNGPEALAELSQCLKYRPNDSEAQSMLVAWKQAGQANIDPLERIMRTFDQAAFHQAAVMLDKMEATRLAALSPQERARTLTSQARDFLSRGLLLESERLYQAAVAADAGAEEAHAGLAEVRERTGDADGARKEAKAALELKPSASAYLVLARLDFAAGHFAEANQEAGEALKLNPNSPAAQDILRQVATKGMAGK
jgi:tetratricopeptide (TPR) repeat protein